MLFFKVFFNFFVCDVNNDIKIFKEVKVTNQNSLRMIYKLIKKKILNL